MSTALRVGVAGLGTVGAATVQLLAGQNAMLAARAGRPIEVTAVSARDRRKNRGADFSQTTWCDDARELAALTHTFKVSQVSHTAVTTATDEVAGVGGADGGGQQCCRRRASGLRGDHLRQLGRTAPAF